jgi:GTP-binding protein
MVITGDKPAKKARVNQVSGFQGLDRVQLSEATAGDIVLVSGI